ncbi:MAG: FISUMP domain-containing protein [Aureispira sp.]
MKLVVLIFITVTIIACNSSLKIGKKIKTFIDPRDGESYQYVEIENRYWMTSNIRYNVEGSKLNPDNPSPTYGRLYNWEQAMKACPEGWRLSRDLDWISLERKIVYNSDDRIKIKQYRGQNVKILKSKKYWPSPGTDSLKMNILPAGSFAHGKFNNLGKVTGFWTSTPHRMGGEAAKMFSYYRIIADNEQGIYYNVQGQHYYYSCRCVKSLENNTYRDA